jgi:glycerol-3-phosphate acyltransferase PlsY
VVAAWVVFAFLLGSVPFAVWLGRGFRGLDVRAVGDGNPGTANAWRAGGWRLGAPVLALDFLKGAVPVAIAHYGWGWDGARLVAVAVAPVVGHDFSPFLCGQGGKGLATTFGVWTGLTLAEVPMVLGASLAAGLGLRLRDGWAVALGLVVLPAVLYLRGWSGAYLAVWLITAALLVWKYRRDLRRSPRRERAPNG